MISDDTPHTLAEAAEAMRIIRAGLHLPPCEDCGMPTDRTYHRCGYPYYVCGDCADARIRDDW